jgi:FkbM family methyltransferase
MATVLSGISNIPNRILEWFGVKIVSIRLSEARTILGLDRFDIGTILDIGANEGSLAREKYAVIFPKATIHCFEPSPTVYPRLEKVAADSCGKIFAHNLAIGDVAGKLSFNSLPDLHQASSLLPATKLTNSLYPQTSRVDCVEVSVKTLDDVVEGLKPAILDDLLIKVDVQGFEERVIRGGQATFSRARACILEVMVDQLYEGQSNFRDIFLALDRLKFEFVGTFDQQCDADGHVIYFDAVFVRRT